MLSRRSTLLLAALSVAAFVAPAAAAPSQPFSAAAFQKAQKEGRSILIKVDAPWCPTCKAQGPIIDALLTTDETFKNYVVFQVDFDSQKDALRLLNAQMQSTLIAFKGKREMSRSVGDVKLESIATLLKKAL